VTYSDKSLPARERLLNAGADLFAKYGYAGASVREICKRADTGVNMIHHYFANKKGLYDEILASFSDTVLLVPIRIITEPPRSRENLISRFEIFVEESLEALIANRQLYEMAVRERMIFAAFQTYTDRLIAFLDAGKTASLVRPDLDIDMLTGFVMDRLGNQVLFAEWMQKTYGYSILTDPAYRKRWLRANLDFVFNGALAPVTTR